MKAVMKHSLIRGTMILTLAGFASRLMGFFFRIFLSRAFGGESVGLYQLIFPVYTLCLSLGTVGIETALSHITAKKMSLGREQEARGALYICLVLTVSLSVAEMILLQRHADPIAALFLGEARCAEMLILISYALPFAAIHACICGFSFGLGRAEIPASSQLVEQTVRILTVILVFLYLDRGTGSPSILLAAAGAAAGEFASAGYSVWCLSRVREFQTSTGRPSLRTLTGNLREVLTLSAPLTASRSAVTLLQSLEAASIPAALQAYGHTASQALGTYGVLTGMALPFILFPSAITNSVGTMLMPAVTSALSRGNQGEARSLTRKAAGTCFTLGMGCCLFFLLTGNLAGLLLFQNSLASRLILTLAWICPFLYTNSALISAINGLGRTGITFLIHAASLTVRILSIYAAVPALGIQGYLYGLLASQLLETLLALAVLRHLT